MDFPPGGSSWFENFVKTHEETIKLLGKKVTLVKPSWYENKYIWGIMGSVPAYYIGYFIGKL